MNRREEQKPKAREMKQDILLDGEMNVLQKVFVWSMTRVGISPFSYFTVKQKAIDLWRRDARSYFCLKRKSHSEDYSTVSPSAGWECSYSSTLRRVTRF